MCASDRSDSVQTRPPEPVPARRPTSEPQDGRHDGRQNHYVNVELSVCYLWLSVVYLMPYCADNINNIALCKLCVEWEL